MMPQAAAMKAKKKDRISETRCLLLPRYCVFEVCEICSYRNSRDSSFHLITHFYRDDDCIKWCFKRERKLKMCMYYMCTGVPWWYSTTYRDVTIRDTFYCTGLRLEYRDTIVVLVLMLFVAVIIRSYLFFFLSCSTVLLLDYESNILQYHRSTVLRWYKVVCVVCGGAGHKLPAFWPSWPSWSSCWSISKLLTVGAPRFPQSYLLLL